ncbi:MAG: hypothetical protein ACI9SP_002633 [Arenicella sp.]|jgi:hypothetical protein
MQADLSVSFSKAQSIRYDVLAYFYRGEEPGTAFGLAPDAAVSGDWCTRVGIGNGLEIFTLGATGSFTSDIDGDETSPGSGVAACFDVPSANSNGTISQTEFGIVLAPSMTVLPSRQMALAQNVIVLHLILTQRLPFSIFLCLRYVSAMITAGNGTNSPDVDGKYFNGDVVQCTITISNAAGREH